MRTVTARAEEQAHRIETVARGEAADIVAEAEARAAARTRQIEQWAEQVISHTGRRKPVFTPSSRPPKRPPLGSFKPSPANGRARRAPSSSCARRSGGRSAWPATGRKPPRPRRVRSAVSTARDDVKPEPLGPAGGTDDLPTGEHPAADMAEGEQFEAKLNAWVTGGGLIEG